MHTKRIVMFGGVACILAMLAYLFVFADGPIVDRAPPAAPLPDRGFPERPAL